MESVKPCSRSLWNEFVNADVFQPVWPGNLACSKS